jgi:micrococcal nuclease
MILRLVLIIFFLNASAWASDNSDDLFNYSKKREEVLVVKVVASDLIVLEDGRRVRLIGVESAGLPPRHYAKFDEKGHLIPEPVEPTIPLQEQALTYAQDLLENRKVILESDVDATDSNGYLLAYVYLPDGKMANEELLRMGFVKLRIVPPNVKYEEQLNMAYQEAKKEKRGLEGE